jgi:hypothetical protein
MKRLIVAAILLISTASMATGKTGMDEITARWLKVVEERTIVALEFGYYCSQSGYTLDETKAKMRKALK